MDKPNDNLSLIDPWRFVYFIKLFYVAKIKFPAFWTMSSLKFFQVLGLVQII